MIQVRVSPDTITEANRVVVRGSMLEWRVAFEGLTSDVTVVLEIYPVGKPDWIYQASAETVEAVVTITIGSDVTSTWAWTVHKYALWIVSGENRICVMQGQINKREVS